MRRPPAPTRLRLRHAPLRRALQLKTHADQLGVPVVWLARKLLTEALDDMLPPDEIRFTRKRTA